MRRRQLSTVVKRHTWARCLSFRARHGAAGFWDQRPGPASLHIGPHYSSDHHNPPTARMVADSLDGIGMCLYLLSYRLALASPCEEAAGEANGGVRVS